MTEIEWCRVNAPTLWKDLSDEELIKKMHQQYMSLNFDASAESFESVEFDPSDINQCLDYMVLELNREFGNKLAFKGGYMLTKLMKTRARQTSDIDFSILSNEIYESIKTKLVAISEHLLALGVIDSYKIKETIQPTMSGGVDMYKNGVKLLGADVGWHDISYGTVIRNLDVGSLNSFEVERMLADKITAILSRKRFRRPKDIYDLYCISETMTFDAYKINSYILKRTEGKGADWHNFPFSDDIIREYEKAYNSLKLVSAYSGEELVRPDFESVLDRFNEIAYRVKGPDFIYHIWDVDRKCFVNERGTIC